MRNRAFARLKRFAAGLALAALLPGGAGAADFGGKTIECLIPFSDRRRLGVWARFFAPYLSGHCRGILTWSSATCPAAARSPAPTNSRARRPDGL